MTVYVITEGHYSDYHIIAVATDKNKAEKLAKVYDADVEEWETDTARDRKVLEGFGLYKVAFSQSGELVYISNFSECAWAKEECKIYRNRWWASNGHLYSLDITVWARNEEEAVKIASEKRALVMAKMEGIT